MTRSQTAEAASMNSAQPVLKPGWNPLNIALLVLGFIAFWPLGLAMLAYIIWGHRWGGFKDDLKRQFSSDIWSSCGANKNHYRTQSTGNESFDAFRESELEKLEEKRQKIERMREEFDDYMEDLRKARDREEFERFMAARKKK